MRRLSMLALLAVAASPLAVRAEVKMPAIFGDHMVLQRDMAVPVWGWAEPGESVTVTAGGSKATATAGADRKWRVKLDPLALGDQPVELTIAGKNTLKFTDVLVGDVWLCAGQSNMGYAFSATGNAADDMPKANHPQLRLFNMTPKIAFEPQAGCVGKWTVCTTSTAGGFSAVGYYFGKNLQQHLKIPVGMIHVSLGGTSVETWTSFEALQGNPETQAVAENFLKNKASLQALTDKYDNVDSPKWRQEWETWRKEVNAPYQEELKKWEAAAKAAKAAGQTPPEKPQPAKPRPNIPPPPNRHTATVMHSGMIVPIQPVAIKGAIWFQGEANTPDPRPYRQLLATMIRDWRTAWGQSDFPFLFAQLSTEGPVTDKNTVSKWALLREAQAATLSVPNTGMAVTLDLGEEDAHFRNKSDVGSRLTLVARRVAYRENVVASGPAYKEMKVEGEKIRVRFQDLGSGLMLAAAPTGTAATLPPPAALKGFAIAGADKVFAKAEAKIDGDSVVVWSDAVKNPVAVRYGWADHPEVNLYNKEGLPAVPFRTDDWPIEIKR